MEADRACEGTPGVWQSVGSVHITESSDSPVPIEQSSVCMVASYRIGQGNRLDSVTCWRWQLVQLRGYGCGQNWGSSHGTMSCVTCAQTLPLVTWAPSPTPPGIGSLLRGLAPW